MDDQNLIFLSYASPDRNAVFTFYDELARAGYNVWMDKRRLKGGQNWDFEIKRALQKAAVVVVFLSHNSVDRRGYAQREIKIALDQANDRLFDDIYLIPVLLERDVPIPSQLDRIQVIGIDGQDAFQALREALDHQLERLGIETANAQAEANIRWILSTYRDQWEGLPGYEVSYQLPHFSSGEFPQVSEITDVVRGRLQRDAMAHREVKFHQDPSLFNFGEDRYRRQNSWEASCGDPLIKGRVISLAYSVWWYGAKAAHPNQGFATFVFTMNPVTEIGSLKSIFSDEEAALEFIKTETRRQLTEARFGEMTNDNEELKLDRDWVERGTEAWDCFDNFAFNEEGIDILFSNYQVAAYVFGPQSVQIPYAKIAPLLRLEIAHLLDVEYMREPLPFPLPSETNIAIDDSEIESASVPAASSEGAA